MSNHFPTITRRRVSFTLVELLVVVAIISILAALLLPALKRARISAQKIICMNSLKQCGIGLALYRDDNDGKMPTNSWALLVPYATSNAIYGRVACPDLYTKNNPDNPRRSVIMGNCNLTDANYGPRPYTELVNPSTTFLVCCGMWAAANTPGHFDQVVGTVPIAGGGWHLPWNGAGLNFGFCDGHVEWASYKGGAGSPTLWHKTRPIVNPDWWRSNYEVFGP
ncbi:MAG: type II secretion system protein [Verrucomicrobia bacterium]|nr:type II secretion system protein [Verrucomicrobiota bacterium]